MNDINYSINENIVPGLLRVLIGQAFNDKRSDKLACDHCSLIDNSREKVDPKKPWVQIGKFKIPSNVFVLLFKH